MKKNIIIVTLAIVSIILLVLNIWQYKNLTRCDIETVKVSDTTSLSKDYIKVLLEETAVTYYDTVIYIVPSKDKKVSVEDNKVSVNKKFLTFEQTFTTSESTYSTYHPDSTKDSSLTNTVPNIDTQQVTICDHLTSTSVSNSVTGYDSVRISIPISHYKMDYHTGDSIKTDLYIEYSGYRASIDSISLISTCEIDIPVKREKKICWSITGGIYAGYGVSFLPDNVYRMSPEIGIGIMLGIGYRLGK